MKMASSRHLVLNLEIKWSLPGMTKTVYNQDTNTKYDVFVDVKCLEIDATASGVKQSGAFVSGQEVSSDSTSQWTCPACRNKAHRAHTYDKGCKLVRKEGKTVKQTVPGSTPLPGAEVSTSSNSGQQRPEAAPELEPNQEPASDQTPEPEENAVHQQKMDQIPYPFH